MDEFIESSLLQLTQKFSNLTQINPRELQISVLLKHGNFFIRIRYQENFPNTPPLLLSCAIADHPLIDVLGIINYPEYFTWTPSTDLCAIISNIEQIFISNPPIPIKEKIFPDFEYYLKTCNKSVRDEEDLRGVIRTIDEFQVFEDEYKDLLKENLSLAKTVKEAKTAYFKRVLENQNKIKEYQNKSEKIIQLETKLEEKKLNYRSSILPAKIQSLDSTLKAQARDILSAFTEKTLPTDSFIATYKQAIKPSKKLQLIKLNP